MDNRNFAVVGAVAVVWIAVVFTSLFAPKFVSGADQSELNVVAMINWLWGGLATAFVLRATVFYPRPAGVAPDKESWPWIGLSVAGIWFAVIVVSVGVPTLTLTSPEVITNNNPMTLPLAAIIAPIVGVSITQYVCQFLVQGFAARAGKTQRQY
ncbi:MAG TPA: hypothetical protein VGC47_14105 [Acidimicrobiia bacterium]|jgi:hypothetical protein